MQPRKIGLYIHEVLYNRGRTEAPADFQGDAAFLKSLPSCCAALLSALLLTAFISCTGNGGSSEMDGDIYTPGGGGYLEMVRAQTAVRAA